MLKYMSRRVKMRRHRRSHLAGGPGGMRYRERGYGSRVVARRAKCA